MPNKVTELLGHYGPTMDTAEIAEFITKLTGQKVPVRQVQRLIARGDIPASQKIRKGQWKTKKPALAKCSYVKLIAAMLEEEEIEPPATLPADETLSPAPEPMKEDGPGTGELDADEDPEEIPPDELDQDPEAAGEVFEDEQGIDHPDPAKTSPEPPAAKEEPKPEKPAPMEQSADPTTAEEKSTPKA